MDGRKVKIKVKAKAVLTIDQALLLNWQLSCQVFRSLRPSGRIRTFSKHRGSELETRRVCACWGLTAAGGELLLLLVGWLKQRW